MSQVETPQPMVAPGRRRSRWRRPLWWILGFLLVTVLAWLGHGAWQDWADGRAWQEYLEEKEQREPGWRGRLYGRSPTAAEEGTRQLLVQLNAAINKPGWDAWTAYRSSLYGGLVQQPDLPEVLLTTEQHEFLRWTRETMKAFVEQGQQIDTLVPLTRELNANLHYDKMLKQASFDLSLLWIINEVTELQAIFWMQENNPEEAVRWLRRSLKLQDMQHRLTAFGRLGTAPYLVERLLNRTEPSDAALAVVQQDLGNLLTAHNRFADLATHLRVEELHLRELHQGEIKERDLNQLAYIFLEYNSTWNEAWARSLRNYYLRYRLSRILRRNDYNRLRLHQLADQIERLGQQSVGEAWPTWKAFAEENHLPREVTFPLPATGTEDVPLAVLTLMPGLHTALVLLFNQEAHLTCAHAAIAAERFRLATGHLPQHWTELVPRYLAKEPIDPYTSRPLQLRTTLQGIVIYSLGCEGRDDGGEKFNHLTFWNYGGRMQNKNTNVGVRLLTPAHRRAEPVGLDEMAQEALRAWKTYQAAKTSEANK